MITVPVSDLKNRFSYFIRLAENGETIQITRHGKPVAKINPGKEAEQQKTKGQIYKEEMEEWRQKASDWLTDEAIDEVFNVPRTIEPLIRHPEDFDW